MTLKQRIQEETSKFAEDMEELKQQNKIDQENLEQLLDDYKKALFYSEDGEVEKINAQVKEVSERINRRKEKIDAFNHKNNPIIQDIAMEELTKMINEIAILEEQAEDKFNELKPLHDQLLKGLKEMEEMKHKVNRLKFAIPRNIDSYLNESNKAKLKFDRFASNKVLDCMTPLFIEGGDVFKI